MNLAGRHDAQLAKKQFVNSSYTCGIIVQAVLFLFICFYFRTNEEEYKDVAKFRRKSHDINKKKRLLPSLFRYVLLRLYMSVLIYCLMILMGWFSVLRCWGCLEANDHFIKNIPFFMLLTLIKAYHRPKGR